MHVNKECCKDNTSRGSQPNQEMEKTGSWWHCFNPAWSHGWKTILSPEVFSLWSIKFHFRWSHLGLDFLWLAAKNILNSLFILSVNTPSKSLLTCFILCGAGVPADLLGMVLESDFPVHFGLIAFCWLWFWCPLMGVPDPDPTIPQSTCNAVSWVTNSVLSNSRFWFLPWRSLGSTSGKKIQ